jgi:hypothetical protein
MKFSNVFVGLAMKQEKFYLLFNCDPMNEIKASSSMNACDVNFKHKQNKNQSSLKLWHCHLGHISRGGLDN